MKGPSTPYWDRLVAKEQRTVKTIKALVAKLLKGEPALTIGTVVAFGGVIGTWIQTNHITTARQGFTLAAPIVLSFVIRQLVVSPATFNEVAHKLALVSLAQAEARITPGAQVNDPKQAGVVNSYVALGVTVIVALFVYFVWIAPHVH